jgi:hypothetical protein
VKIGLISCSHWGLFETGLKAFRGALWRPELADGELVLTADDDFFDEDCDDLWDGTA